MPVGPGARLGPYEILSAIGAGGMGEVYRARDTRLERVVAIKIVPEALTGDVQFRERFDREARVIAALNHPHICTLHDVGRHEGVDYLVLEYLEGQTLADRLTKGALPLDQALSIAVQIADALDKAHRAGIVHRDLKPGNIMLVRRGGPSGPPDAKLLDFGLAKVTPSVVAASGLSMAPTGVTPVTMQGSILGTLQYMAPEQIEGQDVDARTDIFAFGAVLYEMVAGQKAFEGKSQASLIASILEREPPSILSLQPMTPTALDHVVKKCLAKSAESRWQTALDLMDELKWISQSGFVDAGKVPLSARPTRRRYLLLSAGALVILVVGLAIGVASSRRATPEEHSIRLSIPVPDNAVFSWYSSLEISPDGSQVAFVAISEGKQLLWVRPLDSLQAHALSGTDGATSPFWSPDNTYLGYFSGGMLYKIAVAQGVPQALSTVGPAYPSGTWGRDNVIVFTKLLGELYRVSAFGGDAVPVTELDRTKQEFWHRRPHFLPDGTHFLYSARSPVPENNVVYVASIESKEKKRLFIADSEARYAAPGYLLFGKRGVLMTQRFDPDRFELSGESFPVAEAVHYDPEPGTVDASVSATGVLTYRAGYKGARIVWVDRAGKEMSGIAAPGEYRNLALAPDEKSVLFDRYEPQISGRDIWRYDFERATTSRLTFDPADDSDAAWSPDGQNIVFGTARNGVRSLIRKAANGDGQEETLLKTADLQLLFPRQWSSDGRFVTFDAWTSQSADVHLMPLGGNRKSYRLFQSNFPTRMARISHEGRWIAYESDESGKAEIYVQTFPTAGGKWQISTQGGQDPIWRRDDKELFYIAGDGHMMAVSVAGGTPFQAGVAKPLFTATNFPGWSVGGWGRYAVSADGQRFLIDVPSKDTFSPITVVLNWAAELIKKN